MTRSYNLDTEAARAANTGGNFLNETGKFVGIFTRAEAVTAGTGTEGIEFTFKAQDGREAPYLTIYTYKKDGTALPGLKTVNAIMTCLGLREIKPTEGMVDRFEDGKKVPTKATIFPAMQGKPIGLLLQRVEYMKTKGEAAGTIGHKVEIFAPFKADTEQTAIEVLDRAPAGGLARLVERLADKPLPAGKAPHAASAPVPAADFDDDIPF